MIYWLMNKDNKIAVVDVGAYSAAIVETSAVVPIVFGNITDWIDNRTSPVGRNNVESMLKLAGIRGKEEFLKITYGISLTDTFWFKTPDDNMTWDRISPYKN